MFVGLELPKKKISTEEGCSYGPRKRMFCICIYFKSCLYIRSTVLFAPSLFSLHPQNIEPPSPKTTGLKGEVLTFLCSTTSPEAEECSIRSTHPEKSTENPNVIHSNTSSVSPLLILSPCAAPIDIEVATWRADKVDVTQYAAMSVTAVEVHSRSRVMDVRSLILFSSLKAFLGLSGFFWLELERRKMESVVRPRRNKTLPLEGMV